MNENKYEFKGTASPWVIYKATTHAGIKTDAPNQITDIICLDPSPEWHPDNIDKWKYDAHLIAAAPDLLEACKDMIETWEQTGKNNTFEPCIDFMRQCVHKALNIQS